MVRTGDHSFDWNEVFELDLADNINVAFLLYSWDPQSRHRLCYKGTINLVSALKEAPVYNIALKLEPRGSLYVKLRYRNVKQTFQRLPSTTPQTGVFGVPLDILIGREQGTSTEHVLFRVSFFLVTIIARLLCRTSRRADRKNASPASCNSRVALQVDGSVDEINGGRGGRTGN